MRHFVFSHRALIYDISLKTLQLDILTSFNRLKNRGSENLSGLGNSSYLSFSIKKNYSTITSSIL